MNKIIKTTIAALFFCLPAFAQSTAHVDSIIQSIRKEFTTINNYTGFKIEKSEVEGLSTEGGYIEKYTEGKVLRKAVLVLYGESGQLICEYYFAGGKLIFCFEKNETFDKHVSEGPPTKIVSSVESRFYFHNNKLIRWLSGNRIEEKSKYPQREKEIMNDLKGDLKLL